jgi:HPt (histidine-containing phosphotransfer) domain-containing protein
MAGTALERESNAEEKPQEVFVLAEALERVEGDMPLLRELMTLFTRSGQESLVEIEVGLDQNDARRVERAAHSLKGSAGVFGARPVADAAAGLERKGAADDLSGGREAFDTLAAEMQLLLTAFAAQGDGQP